MLHLAERRTDEIGCNARLSDFHDQGRLRKSVLSGRRASLGSPIISSLSGLGPDGNRGPPFGSTERRRKDLRHTLARFTAPAVTDIDRDGERPGKIHEAEKHRTSPADPVSYGVREIDFGLETSEIPARVILRGCGLR